jgi:hypothetical protein
MIDEGRRVAERIQLWIINHQLSIISAKGYPVCGPPSTGTRIEGRAKEDLARIGKTPR